MTEADILREVKRLKEKGVTADELISYGDRLAMVKLGTKTGRGVITTYVLNREVSRQPVTLED